MPENTEGVAGILDPTLEQVLTLARQHLQRVAAFHLPPADPGEAVLGHFHFGIEGLGYEQIREKFDRENTFQEAAKSLDPKDLKHGDRHFVNMANQNDLLASAEKAFIDASRTRLRQSVYATALSRGYGNSKGMFRKFYENLKAAASEGKT